MCNMIRVTHVLFHKFNNRVLGVLFHKLNNRVLGVFKRNKRWIFVWWLHELYTCITRVFSGLMNIRRCIFRVLVTRTIHVYFHTCVIRVFGVFTSTGRLFEEWWFFELYTCCFKRVKHVAFTFQYSSLREWVGIMTGVIYVSDYTCSTREKKHV